MSQNLRALSQFSEFNEEIPLSRELPYWEFENDFVVLADGSLVKGLRLTGVSIETWDAERVNQFITGVRSTLNSVPDGVEVCFYSKVSNNFQEMLGRHKQHAEKNPITKNVSSSRITQIESEVAVSALTRPELFVMVYQRYQESGGKKLSSMIKSFFDPPKKFRLIKKEEHERLLRDLGQTVESLKTNLEGIGIAPQILNQKEIHSLIYSFLNPKRCTQIGTPTFSREYRDQEFLPDETKKVPALLHPTPREQFVFSDLVRGYDFVFWDNTFGRVVSLKTLPEFTYSALVSRLQTLDFPHDLFVHVKVPEQSKELSGLQAKRRMAHSMSISHDGRASDLESEAKLQSTEELLRELINTGQKIFYFQLALLIRADSRDELDTKTKAVLSIFRELNGAEGLAETVGGFKVFKTLLPLGSTSLVRPKRAKTDNLADFIPVYEPYNGFHQKQVDPICLFRNRNGGLVAYDPFDPKLPNYNTLVTGSSGSGKSFLNNLVLLQYMADKPFVYVIDIGGSYRKLSEFLGGSYIEIEPPRQGKSVQAINPFELPPGETEPAPQKIKFLLAFFENILTDREGDRLTKLDKSLLEETIIKLYQNVLKSEKRAPRMSDLANVLSGLKDESLKQFARMLYPWTGDRPYGRLLDQENTFDVKSDFVVFDLKGLSSYPDLQAVMILIITDFILGKVESKDPIFQGRKKRILMDECWELLKSEASSHFMEYCVRTLRKTGSGITFITQGLEEIVASSIGSAILSNTASKFILLQRGDLEPIKQLLKLNEQEISLITSLKQQKGKYSESFLIADDSRTVIRAAPTPIEYWLATSDAADNALLSKRRSENPALSIEETILKLSQEYPWGASGGVVK